MINGANLNVFLQFESVLKDKGAVITFALHHHLAGSLEVLLAQCGVVEYLQIRDTQDIYAVN